MAVTILLVDDHTVVRSALRGMLDDDPGLHVVGEGADGLAAIRLAARLRPQVLVLDLMLPGLHGLEVVRRVTKEVPGTAIVILSMHADEAYALAALKRGALSYVLKSSSTADLITAVQAAATGRAFLSPPLADRLATWNRSDPDPMSDGRYESLTSREREVLQLAAEGRTNSAIGRVLHIGTRTVETHRARLLAKLELRGQSDLVRYAIRRGILSLEE